MAKKPNPLPNLAVPRAEAEQRIKSHIEKIRRIRKQLEFESDFERARTNCAKWLDYNNDLLSRLFESHLVAEEFHKLFGRKMLLYLEQEDYDAFDVLVGKIKDYLESISERTRLIYDLKPGVKLVISPRDIESNKVFIVHGHDDASKETASRYIERLGLQAIVLHEQPNAGRTIIEKFEDHSNVGFAIVLLTPDDIGAPKDKPSHTKSRARQNVILELGYFMGKLGRGRVCALYKEGVEIPSDYQGVLYIPMDSAGAWRMALAKEIKNAGIEVDLNKVL